MHRREMIRMFVLRVISDDYENLHQITKQVGTCSSACGLAVEHGRRDPRNATKGSPNQSSFGDVYFWVTEKGKQLVLTNYDDNDWPYADDNVLRADWKAPED